MATDTLPAGVVCVPCPDCRGSGADPAAFEGICRTCGAASYYQDTVTGARVRLTTCGACRTRHRLGADCPVCVAAARSMAAAADRFMADLFRPLGVTVHDPRD